MKYAGCFAKDGHQNNRKANLSQGEGYVQGAT